MPRSRSVSLRIAALPAPLVLACLRSDLGRRRLSASLRGHADVQWKASIAEVDESLTTSPRQVMAVIIQDDDEGCQSVGALARQLAARGAGTAVLGYLDQKPVNHSALCRLGAAGVHDVLIAGVNDEGFIARTIVLDAFRRGAASRVTRELERRLPKRLQPFAEAVIHYPAGATVTTIAQRMNVHRQTPNYWCRTENYMRAEELLVWCRLFLVVSLLEVTPRTLDSIAIEMDFSSATALRNQLRRYIGMTATQLREVGLSAAVEVFEGRLEQHRSGYAGPRGVDREVSQSAELLANDACA